MADHFRHIYQAQPPAGSNPDTVITQLPSDSTSRRKSHLHGLHHPRRQHRHHHRSSRHHAKEIVQSAIPLQPPTSFGNLLKQAKESISSSPADSRRESVAVADGSPDADSHAGGGLEVPPLRKPARPEDVRREEWKTRVRKQELRSSFQNLSDQSIKTSRLLDDTYYSLLERVAQCRQTIGSLQELANLTQELHHTFESDTKELVEDVQGQFESFGGFKAQQEHVAALEERIIAGKDKADALNARLEEARRRIDARTELEAKLGARNTRHMRIVRSVVGVFLCIVCLTMLFQQLRPVDANHQGYRRTIDAPSHREIMNAPIPDMAKEDIMKRFQPSPNVRSASTTERHAAAHVADDPRLRVFDEL